MTRPPRFLTADVVQALLDYRKELVALAEKTRAREAAAKAGHHEKEAADRLATAMGRRDLARVALDQALLGNEGEPS